MADYIGALTAKKAKLVGARQKIQADADNQIQQINGQIQAIDRAIALLNDAVKDYVCKACGGTGEVRYTDAAGSRDWKECPVCRGTGILVEE